jgi:hypothetical protein
LLLHESKTYRDNRYANVWDSDLFPLKLAPILNRQWRTDRDLSDLLKRFENSSLGLMDPIRLVKAAIPENLSMKVTEIIPQLKDGGAFVKFQHDATIDSEKIESKLPPYAAPAECVCG